MTSPLPFQPQRLKDFLLGYGIGKMFPALNNQYWYL